MEFRNDRKDMEFRKNTNNNILPEKDSGEKGHPHTDPRHDVRPVVRELSSLLQGLDR